MINEGPEQQSIINIDENTCHACRTILCLAGGCCIMSSCIMFVQRAAMLWLCMIYYIVRQYDGVCTTTKVCIMYYHDDIFDRSILEVSTVMVPNRKRLFTEYFLMVYRVLLKFCYFHIKKKKKRYEVNIISVDSIFEQLLNGV